MGGLRRNDCENEGYASTNLHHGSSSAELAVILACKSGYNLEETLPAANPYSKPICRSALMWLEDVTQDLEYWRRDRRSTATARESA